MKTALRTTGIMGLAFVSPLFAIERPTPADAPKEKGELIEAPAGEVIEGPAGDVIEMPKAKAGKMAWLGVAGKPISETLSYHLGVKGGSGISLELVAPGSPAAAAGLKAHDVITKVGGKKIETMNDLRDLMKASKPGDELNAEFYSRGKLEKRAFKLMERPADLPVIPRVRNEARDRLRKFMINPNEMPPNLFQGMDFKERDRIEEMLRDRMNGMQKQFDDMKLDFDDQLNGNGAKMKRMQFNFNNLMDGENLTSKSSVTMSDADGTRFRMQENDEGKELEVKDKNGKLLFSGPYNTDVDKEAVPEELREKIKKFGLDDQDKGRVRLKFKPRR